jgi:hypothetical protein
MNLFTPRSGDAAAGPFSSALQPLERGPSKKITKSRAWEANLGSLSANQTQKFMRGDARSENGPCGTTKVEKFPGCRLGGYGKWNG